MKIKKLLRVFIFLFLISFLTINWNRVSWIFNYRATSGLVEDFFGTEEKENGEIKESQADPVVLEENNSLFFHHKEDSLEIFKIDVFVPLIFGESSEIGQVTRALDRGAVHFSDSALPGEAGRTIVLGHSAPLGWPKIKYDWVFSRLNELSAGDEVVIFFNNKKYRYSVFQKIFLEKGEELSANDLTKNKNVLVLISCWPPGKDLRRIAVEAELIKER